MFSYYDLFGLQATDIEFLNNNYYPFHGTAIFVDANRNFSIATKQTELEANANQLLYGRAIDLEGGTESVESFWSNWQLTPAEPWTTIFCGDSPDD